MLEKRNGEISVKCNCPLVVNDSDIRELVRFTTEAICCIYLTRTWRSNLSQETMESVSANSGVNYRGQMPAA